MDKFIDNVKYAFYYADFYHSDIMHIWLTRNKKLQSYLRTNGFHVYTSTSIKGIWYALRAKVYIYDSRIEEFSHSFLSGGAFRVNLWHGVPLKKIMWDVTYGPMAFPKHNSLRGFFRRIYAPPSLILSTSEKLIPIFSSAFNVLESQIIVGGYYRTMPFFMSDLELNNCLSKIAEQEVIDLVFRLQNDNRKKVIYMPTFRDSNPASLYEAIPSFDNLNKFCVENDILFLLKLHRYKSLNLDLSQYANIINISSELDVYPLLSFTDLLVTDYSSIMFDYNLLLKGIVYYAYDLEEYKRSSRDLYFDYEEIIDSPLCKNLDQVLLEILKIKLIKNRNPVRFFDDPQNFSGLFIEIMNRLGY